ncbi:hypothetical protein AB0D94_33045 [Streptomyces sp. NPDC048255]|uniref:hypothetical protein n=1 Tax=Streptomyces sp. NPDC048255 TaxID=3154713 RepID=UPI0033E00F2F
MKRKIRTAVLAPLTVSSLLLGSVALTSNAAQAVPSASCTVKESATAGRFDVTGKGFQPGKAVLLESRNGTSTSTANAKGEVSSTGFFTSPAVTAVQFGTAEVTCGTVQETEQKDAQDQYRKGFRQGLADTKEDCKKEPPKQGVAPLDPNFEKGYNAGAAAALASADCKG